jgi:purine-binding chemotaxis protein CheW
MATITTTPSMTSTELEQQLVVFSLDGEHYALPITSVREIIRYKPPRSIGQAYGLIQGVISVRGMILPICDLSSRLGATLEIHDASRILIVEASGAAVGLIVDAVDEVLNVAAADIEPLPISDSETGLGDQIAKVGDRLIILLDVQRAFGDALDA